MASNKTALREKYDNFVLNIEFLLISVIQGLALGTLATSSLIPLTNLNLESYPYILSGFLLILIFWSGAINHSLSFIDWPLDMNHNFLYFLLGFVEVLAFTQVTNVNLWFLFINLFFVVAIILYIVDLKLIKDHEDEFRGSERGELYKHILKEQKVELFLLLPLGLIFNLIAYYLATNNIVGSFILGMIQSLFLLGFLINFLYGYKKRAKLISKTLE